MFCHLSVPKSQGQQSNQGSSGIACSPPAESADVKQYVVQLVCDKLMLLLVCQPAMEKNEVLTCKELK